MWFELAMLRIHTNRKHVHPIKVVAPSVYMYVILRASDA